MSPIHSFQQAKALFSSSSPEPHGYPNVLHLLGKLLPRGLARFSSDAERIQPPVDPSTFESGSRRSQPHLNRGAGRPNGAKQPNTCQIERYCPTLVKNISARATRVDGSEYSGDRPLKVVTTNLLIKNTAQRVIRRILRLSKAEEKIETEFFFGRFAVKVSKINHSPQLLKQNE
jgi:hypothetical protein